jgi:hypothetical protein
MALGYTEIAPTQDVSFTAQARMLAKSWMGWDLRKSIWSRMTAAGDPQIFAANYPYA